MQNRTIAIFILLVGITTLIWVFLTILGQATTPPPATLAERVKDIESQSALFTINYLNAALITLLNTAMVASICTYFARQNPVWVAVALVFVPVYALGNLLVYLSQVFVVPGLIQLFHDPQSMSLAGVLLGHAIHEWPGSTAAFINTLSYAILGVSTLILGVVMAQTAAGLRFGGLMLAMSGVLSITALIGVGLGSGLLSSMTLVSGVVYLLALIPIGIYFWRQSVGEPKGSIPSQPEPV